MKLPNWLLTILRFFGLYEDRVELPPTYAPPPSMPATPGASTPGGFNYADPRYNRPSYEILTQVFPGGLPKDWDWGAWAAATGRKDPRATGVPSRSDDASRAGYDLGDGYSDPRENPVIAGRAVTFRFNRRPNGKNAVIKVFGSPGQFFNSMRDGVDIHGEADLSPWRHVYLDGAIDVTNVGPGWHSYTVEVNGSGVLGLQYVNQVE
jgi:hypothetical protein